MPTSHDLKDATIRKADIRPIPRAAGVHDGHRRVVVVHQRWQGRAVRYNGLVGGQNSVQRGQDVEDTGRDGELHIPATDLLGHTGEQAEYVPMLPQRDVEGVRHPRAQPHKGGQLTSRHHNPGVVASIPHPSKGGHQLGDLARLIPYPAAHILLPQEGGRPGAELCAQAQNIVRIGGHGHLAARDFDVVQIGGTPLCARQVKPHGLHETVRLVGADDDVVDHGGNEHPIHPYDGLHERPCGRVGDPARLRGTHGESLQTK
mmetsp:Transcript_66584/g.111358  ORF Transcript_66584/g.111358 Transcript_66584/m.111358 type:complete len:260 (+) Transcript_66584:329-1108(+)